MPGAADVLVISETELDRVVGRLRRALPNEGVGLIGVERIERDGEAIAQARRFYPGSNVRASPTRYEMDARELIAALSDIDRRGLSLGAIAHSHPAGPATPSATDLAEFFYPEALLVIVSFANPTVDVRAWKLEPDHGSWRPRQVPIRRRPDGRNPPGIAGTGTLRE